MDTSTNQNQIQKRTRIGFALITSGGIFSLGWLFWIPSESGITLTRLGMILLLLVVGIVLPLIALTPKGLDLAVKRLSAWNSASVSNRRRIFWLALAALNGVYLLLLAPQAQDIVAQAMLTRISPLLFYVSVVCITGILLLLPTQYPAIRQSVSRQAIGLTLGIFGGTLLGWGLVWLTRWGLNPDSTGWNAMGIPILEVYVFAAWLIAILAGRGVRLWQSKHPGGLPWARFDLLMVIGLYLLAALLWRSTPAPYNWFVTRPFPPNLQPYPSSDALRYDTTAQSLLIGEGLKTDNSIRSFRPLYTGILAVLHALGGPDYQPVIDLQPFVLAVFPIFLYLLGQQMHSRMAGFLLALLIIFREQTAIELSDRITISHAKLLMADLPTAVALAGFIYLAVAWLKADKPRWQMSLFSGGALGISMLIRSESLLLAVVVGLVALLNWRKKASTWVIQLAIFGVGIGLITLPWMYRNWQRYDMLFFDAPEGRLVNVIKRALAVPLTSPEETPSPTASQPQDQATVIPMPTDPAAMLDQPTPAPVNASDQPIDEAAALISGQPQTVAITIINHYFNSEIQSILALPTTFRLPDSLINFAYHRDFSRFWRTCCQAIGYFERMPYWRAWGQLPPEAILPLIANLFLLSTGIAWAYRSIKWTGLFPLMAHIAFLAGNALFRVSGGRYILPVNWILVVYYSLGLTALTLWAGKLLGWGKTLPGWNTDPGEIPPPQNRRPTHWMKFLAPVAGLVLLGWSLPLLESAYPPRYAPETQQRMLQAVKQTLSPAEQAWIDEWLASENIVVRYGQALYPRFLKIGAGERDQDPAVAKRDYARLTFSLIGPYNLRVHLPLAELEDGFPNGEDVLAIGCLYTDDEREVLDAKFVARVDVDGTVHKILWRAEEPASPCMP